MCCSRPTLCTTSHTTALALHLVPRDNPPLLVGHRCRSPSNEFSPFRICQDPADFQGSPALFAVLPAAVCSAADGRTTQPLPTPPPPPDLTPTTTALCNVTGYMYMGHGRFCAGYFSKMSMCMGTASRSHVRRVTGSVSDDMLHQRGTVSVMVSHQHVTSHGCRR